MPPYSPTDWSDGQTPVDAAHLDKIEAGIVAVDTAIPLKQSLSEKGAVNGYAALDATGKVPAAQLPPPAAAVAAIPVGSVVDFAGAAAPAGWLICNGASLLRATYPLLFGVLGTTYGAADGTHFSLPDCRGRMTVGVGQRVEVDTVGDNDGHPVASRRPQHRHTVNESAHGHPITDYGHGHPVNDPGHEHNFAMGSAATGTGSQTVIAAVDSTGYMGEGGPGVIRNKGTGIWLSGAGTGIAINGAFTNISVGNAADYLDAPPYIVLNKIIRTD